MAARDPDRLVRRASTGRQAEDLAAQLLTGRGFEIVARNWRRPEGEVDVVAFHEGTCVFVEVRSRPGEEFGHPLEMVHARKRSLIIRGARLYLAQSQRAANASGSRFDVVGVTFPEDGQPPECVRIE